MGLNIADKASEVLCSDSNVHVSEVFDSGVDTLPESHRERLFYDNLVSRIPNVVYGMSSDHFKKYGIMVVTIVKFFIYRSFTKRHLQRFTRNFLVC